MVALTGSLAMTNAQDDSDIDLMIITSRGTLWVSRFVAYLVLKLTGFQVRSPKDKDEKDKLCVNIWLDEADLCWEKQNIFTAHEISQAVPLVNKDSSWEKFLKENSWVAGYWPNAIGNEYARKKKNTATTNFRVVTFVITFIFRVFNHPAFKLQHMYMYPRITNETVLLNRALFHPVDWSEEITTRLDTP